MTGGPVQGSPAVSGVNYSSRSTSDNYRLGNMTLLPFTGADRGGG